MAENLINRMFKNSFWNFFSLVINRGGALIFTIIISRFLMPEKYGIYSIVLSTTMIFFTFADLGIKSTLVRYLSFALKYDRERISGYYRYLLKIKFILATTASLLFLILAYPLANYVFHNSELLIPFMIGAFYIFVFSFDTFHLHIFYPAEKVNYISIREVMNNLLRVFLALFIFYFLVPEYFIEGLFLSFIFISFFMILYSLIYTQKVLPEVYLKSEKPINRRKVTKFAGYLTIASISAIFFSYVDSIMLGIFLASEYVGYYRVAFSLVFGIIGILSFTNLALLPIFTKTKEETTDKIIHMVFRYLSIIIIPVIIGLIVFSRYFIVILFGDSYLLGLYPLRILAFLIFPAVTIGTLVSVFSAKEKPQIFAKLIFVTSIINIILNLIFIKLFLNISPLFAIIGASIATVISWFIYLFSAIVIIKKEFQISVSFKPIVKPLIAGLVMGIVVYFLYRILDFSIFYFVLNILTGVLIYFLVLILIKGFKKEDLKYFKIVFRNRNVY